jgi:hypothetical protein
MRRIVLTVFGLLLAVSVAQAGPLLSKCYFSAERPTLSGGREVLTDLNAQIRMFPFVADTTGLGVDCNYVGGADKRWLFVADSTYVYFAVEVGGAGPDSALYSMDAVWIAGPTLATSREMTGAIKALSLNTSGAITVGTDATVAGTMVVTGVLTAAGNMVVGGDLTATGVLADDVDTRVLVVGAGGATQLGVTMADTVTVNGSIASDRAGTVGLRFTRIGHPGEPGAIITGPGATCAADRPFPLPGNAPSDGAQLQWVASNSYTQWTNDFSARVLTVSLSATLGDARADSLNPKGTWSAADANQNVYKNIGGTGTCTFLPPRVTGNNTARMMVTGVAAKAVTTHRKAIYVPGMSTAGGCIAGYDPGSITGTFTAVGCGCTAKTDSIIVYAATASAVNLTYTWWR